LELRRDERYILEFRARAEATRDVTLALIQGQAPWKDLGIVQELRLRSDWQPFRRTITVAAEERAALLQFSLGGSDADVEVADVSLRRVQPAPVIGTTPDRSRVARMNAFGMLFWAAVLAVLVLGYSWRKQRRATREDSARGFAPDQN
jgi:hypothetical protein